jgi:ketosteroid isomerase-like protein
MRRALSLLLAAPALLLACTTPEPAEDHAAARREVEAALQGYQAAARSVNPDSVAAWYTATGTLFEPGIKPIQTRDSIRAFVASFPGVRVDVATATADTIEVFGGTAYLWGSYFEKLAFPGQPESEQHGKFVMQWVRQPDGGWLIERLFRVPMPSPPPVAMP